MVWWINKNKTNFTLAFWNLLNCPNEYNLDLDIKISLKMLQYTNYMNQQSCNVFLKTQVKNCIKSITLENTFLTSNIGKNSGKVK